MPDNGAVIITGKLDDSELKKSIDKLVIDIDNKLGIAAQHFEQNIGRMQLSLHSFAQNANTRVTEIKNAFQQLGTTYDQFARAMERAAAAASGLGRGGTGGGTGGSGGTGGTGGTGAQQDTVEWLKEQIELQKKKIDEQKLFTQELQREVNLLAQQKELLKQQTTPKVTLDQQNARKRMQGIMTMPTNELADAERKLRRLQQRLQQTQGTNLLNESQINRVKNAIQQVTEKVEKLRAKAAMPTTMQGVMGMSASNLNEIQTKTAIAKLRSTLPVGSQDIKTLNIEYAKLSKLQDEILGKNIRLTNSNTALGRAFRYIGNRLTFALSIGAVTNFVRQLYEIRGQYELLERSLGVLVNSFQKGTKIFNELNEMAIKSPFTLIELGTAAKQLSAYNFAADEVVDTTKRLADISSALGVPIERLVYNLGQIKAQGVLNARDARDFGNAGLAIVPMLAEMYTAEKRYGDQMVTTAKVYDMMKKKLVTYNDVLKVLYKVTDEGGKFFDFQAKQAGTLKVQLANLNLAWNNMLNDIGTEHQSALTKPIKMLKQLFENWRSLNRVISTLIVTLGVYKTVTALVAVQNGRMVAGSMITSLVAWVKGIKEATGAMATLNAVIRVNPIGLLVSALAAAVSYFVFFKEETQEMSQTVSMFGEDAAKTLGKVRTLYDILRGTDRTSSTYKKTLEELNEVLKENGVETLKESDNLDIVNERRKQAIELIKLESAERQRADSLKKSQEKYNEQLDTLRQELEKNLKEVVIRSDVSSDDITFGAEQIKYKATQISEIIAQVVADNIDEVAGAKTQQEYEKNLNKLLGIIQDRMRAIGIKEAVITKEWVTGAFDDEGIINRYINNVKAARQEQKAYNEDIENNYIAAKKATDSTMTFTQKVEANARALRNNAKDALELYNRIMDIVKIAEQNHVINFDIKLTAEKPPQWMFDKSLQDLEKFARNFAAIAQSAGDKGANVNGVLFTREQLYERSLQYASAAREKQYKEEQKAQEGLNNKRNKGTKSNKSNKKSSDELAEALKNEISIIKKLQSEYDKLVKAGVSQKDALDIVQNAYTTTIEQLNSVMRKYKLPELDLSIIKGKNPNDVLQFFTNLRNILSEKGLTNLARIKAVDGVIEEFTVSAKTYNLEKITKGLNSELDKIKEEYELAVELDANPELGDMFANAFGIDTSDFPKTVQEAVDRMQYATNKAIAEYTFGEGIDIDVDDLMHPFNILNDDIDEWAKSMGLSMSNEFKDSLKKMQHDARDLYEKDAKQTMQEWQKLLEKYAEYETKRSEIQKRAERERETARKKGASKEIIDAINLKEQRDLAKLDFDEFQKSATWITATGDLSKLSNTALQMLINKLVEYKRQAKNLEPKEILKINKALRQLRKEQLKDNPFNALSIASQEAQERAEMFDEEIDEVSEKFNKLLNKREQQGGFLSDEDQKRLEEYKAEFVRLIGLKVEASKTPFLEKVKQVGQYVKAFKTVADTFKQIADSTNDFDLKQTADAISDVIGNFEAAEQGAQTWGGWWGAIIGGVTDAIPKIMKWVSGNAQIDYDIQQSQLQVKKLTNYYKEFEHAAEKALGVDAYGLQKAMLYYKQLELEQLKEQLRLEKSRKSKYRDQSAIAELEGQIIDLKNEIHDSTESIVNDLLGITSKADFAENLVSSMIDAFKEGEDYMKVFEDSFEDMVDNMIMKAIVSRLVGDWINQIWDMVNARAMQSDRAKAAQEEVTRLQNLIEYYKSGQARIGRGKLSEEQIAQAVAGLEKQLQDAISIYNEAITPTPEDIAEMRGFFDAGREDFKENFLAYMDAFGIKFGQSAGAADLSALQQGIQGITEDTAGALEAYMNGVSQQVYLHSDLLTQIRDILINFGGDVTIATNAQILLQLQQSFQVQMTIQTILQGWSNASGLAMRVELVS